MMETKSLLSEKQLNTVLDHIITKKPKTRSDFESAKRIICGRIGCAQPPNRFLLSAYQKLLKKKSISSSTFLEPFLKKAEVRSISGIAVVTSLIKPYLCPGKCVYCPTEVRMPKSYIATEPAAARALRLNFSPYEQMKRRVEMLEINGHNTDKIEFIIKGGTWNAYPIKYQYWFILESFKACNNVKRKKPTNPTEELHWASRPLKELQNALKKEQAYNEKAKHRIIGLTLETRPDAIAPKTIFHMREQGCTRIELGLQAPDDRILKLVNRGHTVDDFRKAIWLLREAGFKVDLHMMPDLPGTTPKHDVEMYKFLFEDPALRPDMVKIYPCTVIKSAELFTWLEDGRYKPYSGKELFEALLEMKLSTPPWCRISRLIRDIPANEIEAGNKITNLREELSTELARRGLSCVCIRCREIGRQKHNIPEDSPSLFVDFYETIGGREYFISFEDSSRKAIHGFLRLRVPNKFAEKAGFLPPTYLTNTITELKSLLPGIKNSAFVRELHVYDTALRIGIRQKNLSQHKGFGARLLHEAETIARQQGFKSISVISGVGVRAYYRSKGYRKTGSYMTKKL
ncbi:MAG: tRNA uridine(34) 5-carboxymethylaminomethyl modification radical SAM/GNAT enzyme Elp3 [Candidatus Magasanikbacteria bacterium]|nr:tRNA uridine(34) 5-carboxymethylaminomethyl modification radical SAM/GNAT enzyme Elp3 [Candidatus Magasanikbacteria bacterium]